MMFCFPHGTLHYLNLFPFELLTSFQENVGAKRMETFSLSHWHVPTRTQNTINTQQVFVEFTDDFLFLFYGRTCSIWKLPG